MQGGCTSWLEKVWAQVSLSLGRERNSLCSVTGGPIGDSGGRIVPWLGYSPSWVGQLEWLAPSLQPVAAEAGRRMGPWGWGGGGGAVELST